MEIETQLEALLAFEKKPPLIVFHWRDNETEAQGWTVINSLKGGAAGGGTRMRKGLNEAEVLALAKTMEVKFTVAGPPIGGAKSGIDFDPADPRKAGVLVRWYKAVLPLLEHYYGTGGDLNVDELHEVIPITSSLGLQHPQQGVLNGHFGYAQEPRASAMKRLQEGVSLRLESSNYSPDVLRNVTVADMITGWGVAQSIKHYYDLWENGKTLDGLRVSLQGWGNVSAAAGYYLTLMGAKIVAILDRAGGIFSKEGMGLEETKALYFGRNGNALYAVGMLDHHEAFSRFWDTPADIFIPGAASKLVTQEQVIRMKQAGISIISCGANVPFADPDIFYGPTTKWADSKMSVIPDFIANCGMARTFAYLMSPEGEVDEALIFEDVSKIIRSALEKLYKSNPSKTNLSAISLIEALK